jgi:hypothetical protein
MGNETLFKDLSVEKLNRLSEQCDKDYKDVSAAQQVRRGILKLIESFSLKDRSTNSARVCQNNISTQETFHVSVEDKLSLFAKMTSQRTATAGGSCVKKPSTFLSFNRFVAAIKDEARFAEVSAVERLFRDMISIAGEKFIYEVDHSEGEFDLLMESRADRHAVAIHVRLV